MIHEMVNAPATISSTLSEKGILKTSDVNIKIKRAIKIPIILEKITKPPELLFFSFRIICY